MKNPYKKPAPKIVYPLRINKYLAHTGKTTRRGADELIRGGRVQINGKNAVLGDKVKEGDTVEIMAARKDVRAGTKGAASSRTGVDTPLYYVAYYKPLGVKTTSHTVAEGEENSDTLDFIEYQGTKLSPMGRLDKNTSGLMIFSNDGRITDRLLNPKHAHEHEYEMQTDKPFSPGFLKALEEHMQASLVEEIEFGNKSQSAAKKHTLFRIVVPGAQGQNIRNLAAQFHLTIVASKRTRILNIGLEGVPIGDYREIHPAFKEVFLATLGLGL